MTSEEMVITEQPISAQRVETTEFSFFGRSKNETNDANLEVLRNHERLVVNQEMDVIGTLCDKCLCCDKLNKYKIKDMDGSTILSAIEEEEDCCPSDCCRRGRRFEMKMEDKSGNEVIRIKWKNRCCGRCLCFCRYENLQVYSPSDTRIGNIEESWNCFHKQLKIYSVSKSDPIYYVNGPQCETCRCCCSDFTFVVSNYETGEECGSIAKKWSGLAEEALTSIDNFGITFPKNASLDEKALLLSTCIMIDLMYFEKTPKKEEID